MNRSPPPLPSTGTGFYMGPSHPWTSPSVHRAHGSWSSPRLPRADLCSAQSSRILGFQPSVNVRPLWSVPDRREVCTAGHGIRPPGQPSGLPATAQRWAGTAPVVRPADLRGGMAPPLVGERTAPASVGPEGVYPCPCSCSWAGLLSLCVQVIWPYPHKPHP